MSIFEVLLQTLSNQEEPLEKRIKLAENAFSAPRFEFRHKESLLLKWILNFPNEQLSMNCVSNLLEKWLSSKQFAEFTHNDITNEDMIFIMQALKSKLGNTNSKLAVLKYVSLLCASASFQHFSKFNINVYCEFIAASINATDSFIEYNNFIKNSSLWPNEVLSAEDFPKHFLSHLYPVLLQKVSEFCLYEQSFVDTVLLIERCVLKGNTRHFITFLNNVFSSEIEPNEENLIPKYMFKFLHRTLPDHKTLSYKLFFAAFCYSFKEPQYRFKCFVLITHLLQFDISNDFQINIPFKLKQNALNFNMATTILLKLLETLSSQNFQNCVISNENPFTDFLRKLLKTLMDLDILDSTILGIILKCIMINPLIIEPIASNLLIFVMMKNHSEFTQYYDKVVVAIFDVFERLHRVENFIAKIVPALKTAFLGAEASNKNVIYPFRGELDVAAATVNELSIESMFTNAILENLSKCLIGLASWQVINVFKTLLHHLKNSILEYSEGNYDDNNSTGLIFIELLGILITNLLQSIKITDHTIPQNVVVKFVAGLEHLKELLKDFGSAILKRHHNRTTMRTFLNLAYIWAEIYITLSYYSINNEVHIATIKDNHYSASSLTYLHSYMTVKEWHLIVQRITNFGTTPCFQLLQRLYVQKVKAMLLLERQVNDETIKGILKVLPTHIRASWQDLLSDKFVMNVLLFKVDKYSLIHLAEHLIENDHKLDDIVIRDSQLLTNVTVYTLMSKINKLFRVKRKRDVDAIQMSLSEKVFRLLPEEAFMSTAPGDMGGVMAHLIQLFEEWQEHSVDSIKSKEGRLAKYLGIMKKLPFIYSETDVQKLILLYLLSLGKDVSVCSQEAYKEVEDLIIGIFQASKFSLADVFNVNVVTTRFIVDFSRHNLVFSLLLDNIFKNDKAVLHLEPLVLHLIQDMDNEQNLAYSILLIQIINRTKKAKLSISTKKKSALYKELILTKMTKLVCKSDLLVDAYALCLKHHLTTDKNSDSTLILLSKLDQYLERCLGNINTVNKKDCAKLFTVVLQNRMQISSLDSDIVVKIWSTCKASDLTEDYSHLVNLIVCAIPNEKFALLVQDLLDMSINCVQTQHWLQLAKQLNTWESVLTCDINPVKMQSWQVSLETLLYELSLILRSCDSDLMRRIVHLEQSILQAQHFILSPPIIDILLSTPSIIMLRPIDTKQFELTFALTISILDMFLKHRNPIVMDRLPVFLQQYRVLLKTVTLKSNSDSGEEECLEEKKAADCVHRLEKLTRNLVPCKKDMGRIAVFLIADILKRYEQINLYPNVKLHLNNCIYNLMPLCDRHAVSYLLRALSRASTEMFKVMYEQYRKYYMFTGKV
ncbi:uncharacterized protein [Euwallacea fornicatus]|uniref:uncharacterized protein n=1 Tax=Euwallacea fornicatus TaxID=995702 RepID=UPI00338F23AD